MPESQPVKKIKVGTLLLQDLDGSLINTDANCINEAALQAYKDAGITDICIFSSMYGNQIGLDLESDAAYSRFKIIKELEKRGFKVHGFISPLDKWLDPPTPGGYYKLWKETYEAIEKILKDNNVTYMQVISATSNEPDLLRLQETIKNLTKSLDDPLTERQRADFARREAIFKDEFMPKLMQLKANENFNGSDIEFFQKVQEDQENNPKYVDLKEMIQSLNVVIFKGRLDVGAENKAEMFTQVQDLFDAESYVLCEDKKEEIEAVKARHAKSKDPAPLTTIRIHTNIKKDKGEVADIPATNKPQDMQAYHARMPAIYDRYMNKFAKHYEKIPGGPSFNAIRSIETNYLANGRATHSRALKNLSMQASKIMNTVTREDRSSAMANLLIQEFERQFTSYNKVRNPLSRFGLKRFDKTYDDFVKTINNDRGDFVAPRQLAEAMQKIKATDPKAFKDLMNKPAFQALQKVNVSLVDRKIDVNALMSEREKATFKDFSQQFKDKNLDERLMFNMLKREITPKMIMDAFPELKNAGLSSKQISEYIIGNKELKPLENHVEKTIRSRDAMNEGLNAISGGSTSVSVEGQKEEIENLIKVMNDAKKFSSEVKGFKERNVMPQVGVKSETKHVQKR